MAINGQKQLFDSTHIQKITKFSTQILFSLVLTQEKFKVNLVKIKQLHTGTTR